MTAPPICTRWRPFAPALAAWGFVAAVVWSRLPRQPLATYGNNGAEWIEHADRVSLGHSLASWFAEPYSPIELVRTLDGSFPPLLHLLSALLPGSSAQSVVWAGMLWAGLLAASVGVVAFRLADRRAGVAAAVATLLLPAVHGSAARYYYDLPMTAMCWAATAALVSRWDRPLKTAWRLPAALAVAACLLKWTAVPFLVVLLVAAVLAVDRGNAATVLGRLAIPKHRTAVLGACLLAWVALCGIYLAVAGEENSLAFMAQESGVVASDTDATGAPAEPAGPVRAALRRIVDPGEPMWMRGVYYAAGWVLSTCSPLLALALVVLLGIAALRRTCGAIFAALVAGGHLSFLLLFVQPIDDRFLLTMTPALVLGAVTGLHSLPAPWARWIGRGLLGIAVLVTIDFHHGQPSGLTRAFSAQPLLLGRRPILQPPQGRGLGAASSTLQLGWSRSDETLPVRLPLREAVWSRLQDCAPAQFAAVDEQPVFAPEGDASWFEYRSRLASSALDDAQSVIVLTWTADMSMDGEPLRERGVQCLDPALDGLPPLERDAVVLAAVELDGTALPPLCPQGVSWRLDGVVQDPDGGPGVAIWSLGGRGCAEPDRLRR